ncbi:MAG TPA: hypothetical protein VNI20_00540 [Fimbriimonadaceae bacterium]|nr:hypothetical protein [Fimbriimonadaceae bacterium]
MIAALALFVLAQTKDDAPVSLPPGSSEAFQSSVFAVQGKVDKGDWQEAARLAARLPRLKFTLDWDDSTVPERDRPFFAKARDKAISMWKAAMPELQIALAKQGDLKIDFVKDLPPNADSPGPAGAVYLFSPDPGDPVVEGVLALLRSENHRPTAPLDVTNETLFAIGSFLGLARQPRALSLMYRAEDPYVAQNVPTPADIRLVRHILDASDEVRKDVKAKRSPGAAAPQIFVSPNKMTPDQVSQGMPMPILLQITNQGKGPLDFRLVPDCGCFLIGEYKDTLAPRETTVVPIGINTIEFTGHLLKTLFVYSNDPVTPIVQVPLDTIVRPAYWFKDLNGDPALVLDEHGGIFQTVMVVDDDQKWTVKSVTASGIPAAVEFEPWTGDLPNPDIGEPSTHRRGYKIRALIAPNIVTGRANLDITIHTSDDKFPTIYHSVLAQRGIVAVPLSCYFGQIGKEKAEASVVLTRPGQPYKITKIESDTDFVSARIEPYRGETEYKLVVTYNGKAPIGRFFGKIIVHTDDPKQPTVEVPFEGTVS